MTPPLLQMQGQQAERKTVDAAGLLLSSRAEEISKVGASKAAPLKEYLSRLLKQDLSIKQGL